MEQIKIIIETLTIFVTSFLIVKEMIRSTQILQQELYNPKGYFNYLQKFYFKTLSNLIILGSLIFIPFLHLVWVKIIYVIILGIYYYFNQYRVVVKLKFTNRIIRLWIFHLAFVTSIYTFVMWKVEFTTIVQVLLICLVSTPIHILLSHLVIYPLEYLIGLCYLKSAQRKLHKVNPRIIAITGSYGKTTTKHILYEILQSKYITTMSPKSYNTLMGLSLTINQYMTKNDELLILEMGATHVGDIKKLTKFISPHYAIITEIGPQHLETFKTVDNIVNEKFAIIDSKNYQLLVTNYDNELIKDFAGGLDNKKIISVGTNQENDFYLDNIKYTNSGINFDICYNNQKLSLFTKLLGRHNLYNILLSVALIKSVEEFNEKITDEEIKYVIGNLKPVPHRLNILQEDGWIILDDSFNSNEKGFINALGVLRNQIGPRILITPGIVGMGEIQYNVNFRLSNVIKDSCDYVYLVDNVSAQAIKEGLESINYKNYIVVKSFEEAYKHAKQSASYGTILIENDLTDNYLIRG